MIPASMSSLIPARSHAIVDSRLRFRFLNAELFGTINQTGDQECQIKLYGKFIP
jgi:hypothetical protein